MNVTPDKLAQGTRVTLPDVLDIPLIVALEDILKTRDLVGNKELLSKSLWHLHGFLFHCVFEKPCLETSGDAQMLRQIYLLFEEFFKGPLEFTDDNPIENYDITSVVVILPLLQNLIMASGANPLGLKTTDQE